MKRIIAALVLLAVALLISTFSLIVTASVTKSISAEAKKLELLLSKEDPASLSAYEELEKQWKRDHKILTTYISHQHLESIERNIVLLGKYIRSSNYDAAEVICADISASAQHLYHSEKPEIQNIF